MITPKVLQFNKPMIELIEAVETIYNENPLWKEEFPTFNDMIYENLDDLSKYGEGIEEGLSKREEYLFVFGVVMASVQHRIALGQMIDKLKDIIEEAL